MSRWAFGDYPGTGIVIKNDYLYASSNSGIYRYKLNDKQEVINPEQPEQIVVRVAGKRTRQVEVDSGR